MISSPKGWTEISLSTTRRLSLLEINQKSAYSGHFYNKSKRLSDRNHSSVLELRVSHQLVALKIDMFCFLQGNSRLLRVLQGCSSGWDL